MILLAKSQVGAISTSLGFIPSSAWGWGTRKAPGLLLPRESQSPQSELAPHDIHISGGRLSSLVSSVMQATESETRESRFESSPARKSWVTLDE